MVGYASQIIYHYRGPPMPSQHPLPPPIYVNASNGQNLYGQTQERIEYSSELKTAKSKPTQLPKN